MISYSTTSKQMDGKLYVVNFWATWCRPCMEELPDFLEVNEAYTVNDQYQMILVSLDKSSALQTEVKSVVQTCRSNQMFCYSMMQKE